MGKVFEFRTGQQVPDEELAVKAEEAAEEKGLVEELREYLGSLDEESVLKVGQGGERDLDGLKYDKIRTVTEPVVEKIVLDAVSQVFDLKERAKAALNNYLQVAAIGEAARSKSGLTVGPLPSPERENLYREIKAKKIELLSKILGKEMVELMDAVKGRLDSEYNTEEWDEEIRERFGRLHLRERGAEETLDAMEAVRISGSGESGSGLGSIAEARQKRADHDKIANLRKAISEGDPATIQGHADRDLDFLAERERRRRSEINQTAARLRMNMLREKILAILASENISVASEK
ncbi:MAG: hypothetical protein RDU25_05970 [Patescibacteria group bacterium]|nr:hypothetical protein [Patescibacteria group bacterium]